MKTRYVVCTDDKKEYLCEKLFWGFSLVDVIANASLYRTEAQAQKAIDSQNVFNPQFLMIEKINVY